MITTILLTMLFGFLSFLVAFLPVGPLPTAIATSVASVWGMVNSFSYIIALDTFIQVLLLVIAFDLIVLLWHLIQWAIRKLPGMQ